MADFEFRISIANRLDQVWQVRVAIAAILAELNVADTDRLHVELAVAEAINNCIEHGYNEKTFGRIDLVSETNENRLLIEISDDGQPLPVTELEDLLRRPIPDPCESMPLLSSGRGLQIIQSTMDSVVFCRRGGRNTVTLRKALRRIYSGPEFPA